METMHFQIAITSYFRTTLFRMQWVFINNLAPMKIYPDGARYAKVAPGTL